MGNTCLVNNKMCEIAGHLVELNDIRIIESNEDTTKRIHRFGKDKDIYDIISYFLDNKSSDDSFYIVDLNEVVKKYKQWARELPNVKMYYAIKSNPDPMIIKILASLGSSFDCASRHEIMTVLSHKIDPNRIILANPTKDVETIQYARSQDVDLMTFDSEAELLKIKVYHPDSNLLIRLKVDDSGSKCKFSCKFGCTIPDVVYLLKYATMLKLNIIGVCFHIGSNCTVAGYYRKALEMSRQVFDIAKKECNISLFTVDLGGGFKGVDEPGQITFADMAKEIRDSLSELFGDIPDLYVMGEPGRFVSTSSHTLVSNIIGFKKITFENEDKKEETRFEYTINEGVYGSYNNIIFDHAKPDILPFNERNENQLFKSTIFGPTCCSLDCITKDAMLPRLAIGEWVFSERMGSYTIASSTSFNGFHSGYVNYIVRESEEE